MTAAEMYTDILVELIRKSGVREWTEAETRAALTVAANEFVDGFLNWDDMAATAVFRKQSGTAKVWKSSGGDGAITFASLANSNGTSTGGRQGVKVDFGATRGEMWRCKATFELAATPTAGNTIDIYLAPSESATAATDNPGNATGADAAYAGYSSNLDAALKQLFFVGSFVVTSQATANVQAAFVGRFAMPARYGSLVVVNRSGAALHSTETNQSVTFTSDEGTSEAS